MKRKKYKYSRGFGPDQGVWIAICGPFELACVDLSCFHVCILTLAYGRHPIWAIRFGLGAICPLIAWGCMVNHTPGFAWNNLKKNNNNAIWGPGIRTQVLLDFELTPSPLNQCTSFVNIMDNKYNMGKTIKCHKI